MLEFFGFAPDPRVPEGAYSWQHLTFVTSLVVIMIVLAAWLGLKNKNKPFKDKNRVLIATALIADFFEILRIVILCLQSDDPDRWTRELPLFLCGLTLIALPLAAFTRGRIQEAALDFVAMFGILGALMGTYGAAQNYANYPVLSFLNVVSGLTHTISGFGSLYILFARMTKMKAKNLWLTTVILLAFSAVSYGVNLLIDYNYMFLMSHDGTPYSIVWDMVGGNAIGYAIAVVGLFIVYILAFWGVFTLCAKRKKPKAE